MPFATVSQENAQHRCADARDFNLAAGRHQTQNTGRTIGTLIEVKNLVQVQHALVWTLTLERFEERLHEFLPL